MELTSIFLFSVRAATNLFPKVINEIILDSLEFREYKLITQSERENNIQNRIWSILLTLSTSPASLPLKAKIGRFLAHCNKCRPASWGLMRDQAVIWYSSLFGWGEGGIRISGGFYVFSLLRGFGDDLVEELHSDCTHYTLHPGFFNSDISLLSIQESRANGSELTLNKNINWFIIQNTNMK